MKRNSSIRQYTNNNNNNMNDDNRFLSLSEKKNLTCRGSQSHHSSITEKNELADRALHSDDKSCSIPKPSRLSCCRKYDGWKGSENSLD